MKSFRKFLAFVLLASFGVSYATVEAHGGGLCDESPQAISASAAQQTQISSHSSAPASSKSTPDVAPCHCQGSTNCQYDSALSVSFKMNESVMVRHAAVFSVLDGISLDGPSRPPRTL